MTKRKTAMGVALPTANEESAFQFTMARVMQFVGFPVLAFLGWQMWTAQGVMQDTLNKMSTSLAVVEERLRTSDADRYTATKATADFAIRDARIESIERDMVALKLLRGSAGQ